MSGASLTFRDHIKRHSGRAGDSWREPESRKFGRTWIPASAGMTLVIVTVFFSWCPFASTGEAPKWKEQWQKTIEGAKREGQLSLYGGQEISHPDILAEFNKEFSFINVVTVAGRAGDLMARITAERRADRYLADVMASGPNGPRTLYLAKD